MVKVKTTKYHSKVVGVTFEGRQDVIKMLKGDEELRVRREPNNEYDPNAVAVDALTSDDWLPIGYLSKDNSEVSTILDEGGEVTIKLAEITGGTDKKKSLGVNIELEHKKLPRDLGPFYTGLMPEILCQPNIPKPLHGVAPRTIMGQKWWDKTRQEVYASTDYHCVGCGVPKIEAKGPKWLEAHEYWEINYDAGTAIIQSIQPLCHYCHNFIHSGRLTGILGKLKSEDEVKRILEHGFRVLKQHKLQCFYGTLELADKVGADTYGVEAYETPESTVEWKDWRLLFDGKEYGSKFRDMEEWHDFYQSENEKETK